MGLRSKWACQTCTPCRMCNWLWKCHSERRCPFIRCKPHLPGCPGGLLYELSNQMITKHFEEGRTIIQQGVPFRGDTDFVSWISKGQVEVCFDGHFVAVLGEGDVFGELACFAEDGVRQATVRSKTRVILRQVKGQA